jgi:hypothetical protein
MGDDGKESKAQTSIDDSLRKKYEGVRYGDVIISRYHPRTINDWIFFLLIISY